MTFYEKVKILCENEGFEISNLGDRITEHKIAKSSLSRWKNGAKPRAKNIKAIADYFGVSVEYLTNEERELTEKSNKDIKTALFGEDVTVTDEMWNELMSYVEFLKSKYKVDQGRV